MYEETSNTLHKLAKANLVIVKIEKNEIFSGKEYVKLCHINGMLLW